MIFEQLLLLLLLTNYNGSVRYKAIEKDILKYELNTSTKRQWKILTTFKLNKEQQEMNISD